MCEDANRRGFSPCRSNLRLCSNRRVGTPVVCRRRNRGSEPSNVLRRQRGYLLPWLRRAEGGSESQGEHDRDVSGVLPSYFAPVSAVRPTSYGPTAPSHGEWPRHIEHPDCCGHYSQDPPRRELPKPRRLLPGFQRSTTRTGASEDKQKTPWVGWPAPFAGVGAVLSNPRTTPVWSPSVNNPPTTRSNRTTRVGQRNAAVRASQGFVAAVDCCCPFRPVSLHEAVTSPPIMSRSSIDRRGF
jgi:hypothetical protein